MGGCMRASFKKWWLLPFGVLAALALVALGIVVVGPSFISSPSDGEVAQQTTSEPIEKAADCSGASATEFSCYQKRYQNLVRDYGVKATFDELKDEYEKNEFVHSSCHQLTHLIGYTAYDLYGDIPSTYSQGDNFCWSGYYHGAMQAFVAKIGPERILEEANTTCADQGQHQRYSFYHYNCVHGLGHGFMAVRENELFESLEMCDTLLEDWERESCYSGVFMENVVAKDNSDHPSKYLKADQPLYPCTDVEPHYKTQCYRMQTSYALHTQGNDFAKVFDLCATIEDDYRPACYQSLGRDASGQSDHDVAKTKSTCMLGKDYEAQSECVLEAVRNIISYYDSDEQAKALCESFDADFRAACLQTAEEYYRIFLI